MQMSVNYKIMEATDGMRRCSARAIGFLPHMVAEYESLMAYYATWQAIAISWASR